MTTGLIQKSSRLGVVDALRGFALCAIVLLHNLEHFNIYFIPEWVPNWLLVFDKALWDFMFFAMAGKAYAIFSLLFGFSFYIQFSNARKRGEDFRLRFAWRMVLLALFAQLNSLLYNGDILLLYAFVGILIIPTANLKDRTVLIIAIVLLLQPFEWGRVIYNYINPDYIPGGNRSLSYYARSLSVLEEGGFWETVKSNITDGQVFSNIWQVENGRLFQTSGLFLLGMFLGRRQLFVRSDGSVRVWKKVLLWSAVFAVPLYLLKAYLPGIMREEVLIPLGIALLSHSNLALMLVIVSGFMLLWFRRDGMAWQKLFIPYGRMSLTNYITQSMIGACIYYGFGFGLYRYTGASLSLLIGVGMFTLQLLFSRWWLSRHKQGPLEYLWGKGTWINSKR